MWLQNTNFLVILHALSGPTGDFYMAQIIHSRSVSWRYFFQNIWYYSLSPLQFTTVFSTLRQVHVFFNVSRILWTCTLQRRMWSLPFRSWDRIFTVCISHVGVPRATCLNISLLILISLIMFCEACKLWGSPLCSFYILFSSSAVCPNVLFISSFSDNLDRFLPVRPSYYCH